MKAWKGGKKEKERSKVKWEGERRKRGKEGRKRGRVGIESEGTSTCRGRKK